MDKKGCLTAFLVFFVIIMLTVGLGILSVVVLGAAASETLTTSGYEEQVVSSGNGTDKVVLIDIKGEISNSDASSLFGGSVASAPQIMDQIDEAINDESVVGIMFEMDSPGGEVVAADMIYQKVLEAKQAGKKIITYIHTVGASGGVYIAVASDLIFVNELTTTGSIGVYSLFQDVSGLYEKLGIKQRIIKAGEYKTGEGLFDADDEGVEDQIYQDMIDIVYEKFVSVVATGRSLSTSDVREFADGRVFLGEEAINLGLADELGGMPEAIDSMHEISGSSDFTVVRYYSHDFLSDVFSVLGQLNLTSNLLDIANQEEGVKLMYKLQ